LAERYGFVFAKGTGMIFVVIIFKNIILYEFKLPRIYNSIIDKTLETFSINYSEI